MFDAYDNVRLKLLAFTVYTSVIPHVDAAVNLTHSPEEVYVNTSLTLTCQYDGGDTPGTYTWKLNGVTVGSLIYKDSNCEVFLVTPDSTLYSYICPDRKKAQFTVLNIGRNNNGDNWQCQIGFASGDNKKSNNLTLVVRVPVTSVTIIKPTSATVAWRENTDETFECETSISQPIPKITWYLQDGTSGSDRLIPSGVQQTPAPNTNVLQATRGNLTYPAARQDNGNQLYCSAGGIKSNEKLLNIKYPQNLTKIDNYTRDSTYNVIPGRQQTLTCRSVDGNPLPTLQWSCFSGTDSDNVSGRVVSSVRTWTTNIDGTCTCESVHEYGNQRYSLNVLVLEAVNSVKPKINNIEVSGNVKVIHDSDVPIICSASGTPAISYQWKHGSDIIQGRSLHTRDIPVDGTYTCTARNVLKPTQGEQEPHTASSSLQIERLYTSTPVIRYRDGTGPLVTTQVRVVQGTTFNLHCYVDSNPVSSYTWNYGNTGTALLTISGLQNDRQFICTTTTIMVPTVGTNDTRTKSASVNITILEPPTTPVISYHYSSTVVKIDVNTIRVIEGLTFSISCSSTGKPNPAVTWSNHGTSDRIQFTAITKNDDGEYTCMARNSMNTSFDGLVPGTSLNNISIHVLYPPVVQPLLDVTVIEGRSPDNPVICRVTPGNPSVTKITWLKNKEIKAKQSNVRELQLPLTSVSRVQDGVYVCVGENTMNPTAGGNRVGSDSQGFNLTVYYEASVNKFGGINQHDDSQELTVNENDETNLRCITDSKPGSTISITRDDEVKVRLERTNEVLYQIEKTSCLDFGLYTCIGYNDVINQTSRPKKNLQLHVTCGPRISPINKTETNQTSALNKTTSLQVYILAYPTLSATQLTWKKRSGSEYVTVQGDRMRSEISTGGIITTASLVIQDVQQSDFGEYLLHVEHEIQDTNITIFFVPKDKPSAPTNLGYEPEQLTESSVVVYWSPGFNGGLPQNFTIKIRKADGSGWFVEKIVEDTGDDVMNTTLTGLESGTHYIVRVYATNELGNSTAASELAFVTASLESPSSGNIAAIIGGAAGGSVGFIVVAVAVVFLKRKNLLFKGKGGSDVELHKRPVVESNVSDDDDADGMQPNPLYETSGPITSPVRGAAAHEGLYSTPIKKSKPEIAPSSGDIYASVNKASPSKKNDPKNALQTGDTQVEVKGKNKGAKPKKKNGKSSTSNKDGQIGDVYENVEAVKGKAANDLKHQEPKGKNVNQDGLIYADLTFSDQPKGKKLVIIGDDDRTPYAEVDFSKKADPLPESDDEK